MLLSHVRLVATPFHCHYLSLAVNRNDVIPDSENWRVKHETILVIFIRAITIYLTDMGAAALTSTVSQ